MPFVADRIKKNEKPLRKEEIKEGKEEEKKKGEKGGKRRPGHFPTLALAARGRLGFWLGFSL